MSTQDTTTLRPAQQFFKLIRASIDQIRADVPKLTDLAEKMTKPLLEGGGLFTPDIGVYWPSEFGGRAGGIMGLKRSNYVAQSSNDVAFTTLPDPRNWKPAEDKAWKRKPLIRRHVFVIGREDIAKIGRAVSRFAGFTGGAAMDEGLFAHGDIKPIAPLRPFEQLVRGWLTAGELITAATRAGRMPILWMSVWLEGALPRNATFFKHDNMREPWFPPLFHDRRCIPPLAAGYAANFAFPGEELDRIFNIVVTQADRLSKAGRWCAHEALQAKKKISTVLVGHSLIHADSRDQRRPANIRWRGCAVDQRSVACPSGRTRCRRCLPCIWAIRQSMCPTYNASSRPRR